MAHTTARNQALTPEAIGAIIEDQRTRLNLTQSAAARKAGIARGTWHHIEKGHRVNIQPETMNAIDETLGWEPGRLRTMFRPVYMGPDVIIPTADGGMLMAEFKSSGAPDPTNILADRQRRLSVYLWKLRADQLDQVLTFIERDVDKDDHRATIAEQDAMKKFIEEEVKRQVTERLNDQSDGAPVGE